MKDLGDFLMTMVVGGGVLWLGSRVVAKTTGWTPALSVPGSAALAAANALLLTAGRRALAPRPAPEPLPPAE